MMMHVEVNQIYTPDEYLDLEVNSDIQHEYINGEILPMTGGTPEQNEIASIFNTALRVSLKERPYSIFIADQRLWIPDRHLYHLPACDGCAPSDRTTAGANRHHYQSCDDCRSAF